jgi:hypothetical protein
VTVPASFAGATAGRAPSLEPDTPETGAQPQVTLVDPPSPAELIEGMVATWRGALVEAAGGSMLVDVDDLGDAVLDLSAAHPSGLAQLFAGRPTRLSSLVREGAALATARRKARAVGARATVYTQQYGIAPTSLAIGIASWTERTVPDVASDDVAALASATRPGADTAARVDAADPAAVPVPRPRVVRTPVLLRPVTLRARGAAEADYELSLEPTVEVNPVLARALRAHGALLDPAALARGTFTDVGFDPHGALARLASLGWAVLEDFTLTERVVVGTFVHPGQVLVDDLDALAGSVSHHEVLAALAGVPAVREALGRPVPAAVPGDRDPRLDRGVGDLDPVQQHLVDVVATGAHVFVDAPAGTDVTGTLAGVVADAAAAGRTVLYVPGHRRAATALADRLERLGVGDLLLDVAPEAGWRSAASRRLLAAMTLEQSVPDEGSADRLRRSLVEHREALRGYVCGLHAPRQPWGVSAYDALQALARLTSTRPTPRTTVRLDPDVARVLDCPARAQAAADLRRAGELGAFSLRPSDTPWYGAELATPAEARTALARIDRLLGTLPEVMARAEAIAADTGLTAPASVDAWGDQLRMLDEVRASLDVFQPLVFERTAADLVAATATKAWRAEHGVEMGRWVRRRLRKQARDMLRPGRPIADLHTALLDVQRRRELWQEQCPGGGWPRLPDGLEVVEADHAAVRRDVDALDEVLAATPEGAGLGALPIGELVERLTRLRDGAAALDALPARTALVRHLRGAGLGALVDDLAERRVAPSLATAELELAWWSTVFEQILAADPALAGYDGAALGALSARYAELDEAHVAALAAPVRDAAIKAMGAALRQHPDQAEGLFGELIEERVTSLRDVMARYPDVARRLRPVVAASPMVVPQVLPASRTVDLVVLDAATRMPIEVVVPAIARGRQVVVVGDTRCASGSAVRELAAVLPHLELHADASRRDPWLTAFLVDHGYAGALRPTPLPTHLPLVDLVQVDGTGLPGVESGIVDSTHEEVARVVELVVEHALAHPDESLAVVTVTPRHADAVRDQVLGEARTNPALAAFFDAARPDPFVVVDLPNVAGLRRDAVILSLGLGRTPHRRVLHAFGPISAPAGDCLLLDAVGCAQHRLTVVAAFGADDLDPGRLRGPGPRLLADLLAFAQRRGRGDDDPLAPLRPPAAGAGADAAAVADDEAGGFSGEGAGSAGGARPGSVHGAAAGSAGGRAPDLGGAAAAGSGDGAGGVPGHAGGTTAHSADGITPDPAAGAAAGSGVGSVAGIAPDSAVDAASVPAAGAAAGSADGITAAYDEPAAGEPDTPGEPDRLVLDLAERLWRHGLTVEVDHGIPGGVRIPLVVGHPDVPDRFLVAVLTDDEAYTDEPSVRVRDRLVPERLERLGWSVLRVWAVAAFLDPQAEVDRIRRAVQAALPEPVAVPASPRVAPRVPDDWSASGEVPSVAAAVAAAPAASATVAGTAAGDPVAVVPSATAATPASAGPDATVLPGAGADGDPASSSAPFSVAGAVDLDALTAAPVVDRGAAPAARTSSARRPPAGRLPAETASPAGVASSMGTASSVDGPSSSAAASASPAEQTTGAPGPSEPSSSATAPATPGEQVASAPVRVTTGVQRHVPKQRTGEVEIALAPPAPRPRPDIRKGLPIGAYSDDQLDELATWLRADGTERTRDELADALRAELGLTRRNHRVDTAIRAAVTRAMR